MIKPGAILSLLQSTISLVTRTPGGNCNQGVEIYQGTGQLHRQNSSEWMILCFLGFLRTLGFPGQPAWPFLKNAPSKRNYLGGMIQWDPQISSLRAHCQGMIQLIESWVVSWLKSHRSLWKYNVKHCVKTWGGHWYLASDSHKSDLAHAAGILNAQCGF